MKSTASNIAQFPPVVDISNAQKILPHGRTALYLLAKEGEITSLMLGNPGRSGKRTFLTQSLFDYLDRQLAKAAQKSNRPARKRKEGASPAPLHAVDAVA